MLDSFESRLEKIRKAGFKRKETFFDSTRKNIMTLLENPTGGLKIKRTSELGLQSEIDNIELFMESRGILIKKRRSREKVGDKTNYTVLLTISGIKDLTQNILSDSNKSAKKEVKKQSEKSKEMILIEYLTEHQGQLLDVQEISKETAIVNKTIIYLFSLFNKELEKYGRGLLIENIRGIGYVYGTEKEREEVKKKTERKKDTQNTVKGKTKSEAGFEKLMAFIENVENQGKITSRESLYTIGEIDKYTFRKLCSKLKTTCQEKGLQITKVYGKGFIFGKKEVVEARLQEERTVSKKAKESRIDTFQNEIDAIFNYFQENQGRLITSKEIVKTLKISQAKMKRVIQRAKTVIDGKSKDIFLKGFKAKGYIYGTTEEIAIATASKKNGETAKIKAEKNKKISAERIKVLLNEMYTSGKLYSREEICSTFGIKVGSFGYLKAMIIGEAEKRNATISDEKDRGYFSMLGRGFYFYGTEEKTDQERKKRKVVEADTTVGKEEKSREIGKTGNDGKQEKQGNITGEMQSIDKRKYGKGGRTRPSQSKEGLLEISKRVEVVKGTFQMPGEDILGNFAGNLENKTFAGVPLDSDEYYFLILLSRLPKVSTAEVRKYLQLSESVDEGTLNLYLMTLKASVERKLQGIIKIKKLDSSYVLFREKGSSSFGTKGNTKSYQTLDKKGSIPMKVIQILAFLQEQPLMQSLGKTIQEKFDILESTLIKYISDINRVCKEKQRGFRVSSTDGVVKILKKEEVKTLEQEKKQKKKQEKKDKNSLSKKTKEVYDFLKSQPSESASFTTMIQKFGISKPTILFYVVQINRFFRQTESSPKQKVIVKGETIMMITEGQESKEFTMRQNETATSTDIHVTTNVQERPKTFTTNQQKGGTVWKVKALTITDNLPAYHFGVTEEILKKIIASNNDISLTLEPRAVNGKSFSEEEFLFYCFLLANRGKEMDLVSIFCANGGKKEEFSLQGGGLKEKLLLLKSSINAKFGNASLSCIQFSEKKFRIPILENFSKEVNIFDHTVRIYKDQRILEIINGDGKKREISNLTQDAFNYMIKICNKDNFTLPLSGGDRQIIEALNSIFSNNGLYLRLKIATSNGTVRLATLAEGNTTGEDSMTKEKDCYTESILDKREDILKSLSSLTKKDSIWFNPSEDKIIYINEQDSTNVEVVLSKEEFIIYMVFFQAFIKGKQATSYKNLAAHLQIEHSYKFEEYMRTKIESINKKLEKEKCKYMLSKGKSNSYGITKLL